MGETRTIRDRFTQADIDALSLHPDWADGRTGYEWCRFDASISPEGDERRLRAEITFDDDSDFEDNENAVPTCYFDPKLWIETNTRESHGSYATLKTFDGIASEISRQDVYTLLMGDPAAILDKYADVIARISVPAVTES